MNDVTTDQSKYGRSLEQEANLGRDIYFAPKYFLRSQLFSQAAQLNAIHQLGGDSILEIGPGNGFVADFLRAAGRHVDTVDVNMDLRPTFQGSVLELDQIVEAKSYDTVVCCEVLEHLPFASFPRALEQIARAARKSVLITLPQAKKYFFSLGGALQVPGRGVRWFLWAPTFGRKQPIYRDHHWELEWKKEHRIANVRKLMSKHFTVKECGPEPMNPYHVFFQLRVKDA